MKEDLSFFTRPTAFGRNKVAESYLYERLVTDETRAENSRIRAEQRGNPNHFSPETIKRLVLLTEEKDDPGWPDGPKVVGGDVDIARVTKNGKVQWLHRKAKCAIQDNNL